MGMRPAISYQELLLNGMEFGTPYSIFCDMHVAGGTKPSPKSTFNQLVAQAS